MIEELTTDIHSIFSDKRTLEREEILRVKDGGAYILAWGKDKFLLDLAEKALPHIPINRVGVQHNSSSFLFSHASPLLHQGKVEWLQAIMEQLG